jgi:hypothetical protein
LQLLEETGTGFKSILFLQKEVFVMNKYLMMPGSKGQKALCLHKKHFDLETRPNMRK